MKSISPPRRAPLRWVNRGWALLALWAGTTLATPIPAIHSSQQRFEFVQIRMGVPVRILVYADNSQTAIQLSDAAYERIRQLDRILSDYDPDSEVSKLCAVPPGTPVVVSTDLREVLAASKSLSALTEGAFDASVGPLVKLWRVARRKKQLPDAGALEQALQRTGDSFVELDAAKSTVTLHRPGMQLDFGGIAKGYAADQALQVLREGGCPRALVAVAGDICVGDPPVGKSGWQVEVEDGTQPPGPDRPQLVLTLANQAVSTSGDTYQFLELNGLRYSHIVNPQTGLGLTTPSSVTVIAPTSMQADGLASGLSVLGPERGIKLLDKLPGTAALFVQLQTDQSRRVYTSSAWPAELGGDANE